MPRLAPWEQSQQITMDLEAQNYSPGAKGEMCSWQERGGFIPGGTNRREAKILTINYGTEVFF